MFRALWDPDKAVSYLIHLSRMWSSIVICSLQVSTKGSLTGGYFNKSRSRLEIQKTRSEKMEEITSQDEEMKDLRQKLYDVEAEINKV